MTLTYQEFNHIFYKYTNQKRGVRYTNRYTLTGEELKEFVEHAIKCYFNDNSNGEITLGI